MARREKWSIEAVAAARKPMYVPEPGEGDPHAYLFGDPRFRPPPPKTRLGRVLRWVGL